MNVSNHPLHWPAGWARTASSDQKDANFKHQGRRLTIADGITRVLDALRKMGVPSWNVIISTNMAVRGDGLPYSGRRPPEDAGAAVYWRPDEESEGYQCIAIDQYTRLGDNLAAIAGTLDCLRAIERWGGAKILQRASAGFKELPGSGSSNPGVWWAVLGVTQGSDFDTVRAAYQQKRKSTHPDHGGTTEQFKAVQQAWRQFQEQYDE